MFHIRAQAEIVTVPDPEIQLENLVEHKHHRLARSLRSGPTDRDLKPNAATRDQLNVSWDNYAMLDYLFIAFIMFMLT